MFHRARRWLAREARRTAPSFMPSLTGLFFGLFALYALSLPLLSGDLGWHIRLGDRILESGRVPRLNVFSFTAPWHPWQTHEWLSGVLFALVDRAGGLPLLFALRAVLFVSTLALLHRLGRRIGADPLLLAALMLPTAIALALHVSLRPWVFSNLFLAALLHLSRTWRDHPDRLAVPWLVAVLLGAWINLHGAFIVGLGFSAWLFVRCFRCKAPGDAAVAMDDRRLNALNASMVLIGFILTNPFGTDALALPLLYMIGDTSTGMALTSSIKEWAPLDMDSFFGRLFVIWLILGVGAVARRPRLIGRPEFIFGLVLSVLTIRSQRHFPVAVIFLFPVVAEGLLTLESTANEADEHSRQARWRARWRAFSREEGRGREGFFALLSLALLLWFGTVARSPKFEERALHARAYPMEAIRILGERPAGRLFNYYDWAGILEWRSPSWPLFITPANDAYPREIFEEWFAIANLEPGWERRLERWRVDTVLMPTGSALASTLRHSPAWRTLSADERGVLLVRRK